MDTYITLSCLLVGAIIFAGWLIYHHYQHEKKYLNSFEKPLDNKGKWWYN